MSYLVITYRVERFNAPSKSWVFVGLRSSLDQAMDLRAQQEERTELQYRIIKCETTETELAD